MRRCHAILSLVIPLVGLAGCTGGGTVTLPTAVASSTLPSVSRPAITLPTRTQPEAPAVTETRTPTPAPSETKPPAVTKPPPETPAETRTVTQTQTQTQTQTATATETQTQTQTQTVTETVTPTPTETPTPTPSATQPAPETTPVSGESTTWWPWLLLALAVLGGLGWLLLRRRAALQLLAAWDEQLQQARGEASWVEESLVGQVLSMPTTAQALAVWTAAGPRLLAIDESLHALVGDAPDEERAAAAVVLRERLARVVETVGADTSAPEGSAPDEFRARRAAIDSARRGLRAVLGPVVPVVPVEPPDGAAGSPGPGMT